MNKTPQKFDVDAIDFFVRKAHKERSDAMTGAFIGLAEMVKNIFSAPETGQMARDH